MAVDFIEVMSERKLDDWQRRIIVRFERLGSLKLTTKEAGRVLYKMGVVVSNSTKYVGRAGEKSTG